MIQRQRLDEMFSRICMTQKERIQSEWRGIHPLTAERQREKRWWWRKEEYVSGFPLSLSLSVGVLMYLLLPLFVVQQSGRSVSAASLSVEEISSDEIVQTVSNAHTNSHT